MRIVELNENSKKNILEDLLKRSPNNYDQFADSVNEILAEVKKNGDDALFAYTKKFDGADLDASNILVTEEEIKEAYDSLENKELVDIIRKSLNNIKMYHEKQKQYSWFDSKPDGTMLGQKVTPIFKVGVYVPGGKAAYPSSVLMYVIPAKVAGVEEIVMVTPPRKDGKVTPTTLVAACEAGVDVIDTAMSPFAMGTSQPATEVMVETFRGTPYDTGFDQNLLAEIADYFRPYRDECLKSGLLNPKVMGVDIKTLLYQVPGGMLSNMVSQLKEQNAEDKYYDVLEEVPKVRKDLGEPPLVTPSSQIVGTQAVFNVLMGERYKMATKETKDVLSGKYGETVKPFNEEVRKKVLGEDAEIITCRPADLIPDELDTLRNEMAKWSQQDEDVLSYALFPQVATDFFKYREAQQTKIDPNAADTENGSYPV